MRNAILIAALLFPAPAMATDWCAINIPPAEYQYEPTQDYVVFEWPHEMLAGMCRGDGSMQWRPEGKHGGCTVFSAEQSGVDFIYLVSGLSPEQRECVLVHEKAHLNGWGHGPSGWHYQDESGEYRPQRGPRFRVKRP